jgi:hypothetical protein
MQFLFDYSAIFRNNLQFQDEPFYFLDIPLYRPIHEKSAQKD